MSLREAWETDDLLQQNPVFQNLWKTQIDFQEELIGKYQVLGVRHYLSIPMFTAKLWPVGSGCGIEQCKQEFKCGMEMTWRFSDALQRKYLFLSYVSPKHPNDVPNFTLLKAKSLEREFIFWDPGPTSPVEIGPSHYPTNPTPLLNVLWNICWNFVDTYQISQDGWDSFWLTSFTAYVPRSFGVIWRSADLEAQYDDTHAKPYCKFLQYNIPGIHSTRFYRSINDNASDVNSENEYNDNDSDDDCNDEWGAHSISWVMNGFEYHCLKECFKHGGKFQKIYAPTFATITIAYNCWIGHITEDIKAKLIDQWGLRAASNFQTQWDQRMAECPFSLFACIMKDSEVKAWSVHDIGQFVSDFEAGQNALWTYLDSQHEKLSKLQGHKREHIKRKQVQ